MKIAWFAYFQDRDETGAPVSEAERKAVTEIVAATPGLDRGLVFTPWPLNDLFFEDGTPPRLALQLYFNDIADLEAALAPAGHLQALADPASLPGLAAGGEVHEQAMLSRPFATPDPAFRTPDGAPHCSFLVHYPGAAQNFSDWLAHYLAHHTRIMATFPAIRQVEVCTRIDWTSAMPWQKVFHMQRNKVVYDDGESLRRAQMSPTLKEMRADFHQFPPFTGGNIHHPMATWPVGAR